MIEKHVCAIAGFFGEGAGKEVRAALLKMERGDDGAGIWCDGKLQHEKSTERLSLDGKLALGHRRHAVVGDVAQPVVGKGVLVANCEIYNWKELRKKYGISAKNDAELLLGLLDRIGKEAIALLDGVYAFAYLKDKKVLLARDILGVKPLWVSKSGFASEKKALFEGRELNPRTVLEMGEGGGRIIDRREFFRVLPENDGSKLEELFMDAVKKRIPKGRFGLLFSGGIDSVLIALALKRMGADFCGYVAGDGRDSEFAVYAAKKIGIKLKRVKLSGEVKKVVRAIESGEVVKVGVALTLDAALKEGAKDGIKVMFSGMGAEDTFGGYSRQRNAKSLNGELRSGLLRLHEKDLYTQDLISMANGVELRLPFLDRDLVGYALKVPEGMKTKNGKTKEILRRLAKKMGANEKIAGRKKVAAQYGSGADVLIRKKARESGKTKAEYLAGFVEKRPRVGVLASSGKDSWYAAYLLERQGYELACVISVFSDNQESYMFHTPNVGLVKIQAEMAGLPLVTVRTKGEKEKELNDLERAVLEAKGYGIDGVCVGALASTYQRDRVQKICEKTGFKMYAPLWLADQEGEMRALIKAGFKVVMTSVNAYGLDKSWLGRVLGEEDVNKLVELKKKYGINVAGEGGEYESLVLSCPLFEGELEIEKSEIESGTNSAFLKVTKVSVNT